MSVLEPLLRRLPPKVVIPALLAAVMALAGHAFANWRNGTSTVLAAIAKADEKAAAADRRVQQAEVGLAAEVASRAQAQQDVMRRLDSIESKLDRALRRRTEGDSK